MDTSTTGLIASGGNSITDSNSFVTIADNYCLKCNIHFNGWHWCYVNNEIKKESDKTMSELKDHFDIEIKKVNEKIDELSLCVKEILTEMKKTNKTCEKMGDHIDFVENVYDKVKKPLAYISHAVGKLSGNSGIEDLPAIK